MKIHLSIILLLIYATAVISCSEKREFAKVPPSGAISQPTAAPQTAPEPIKKSNTAIVISPHANLRQSDNASAAVLRVVPQDASVEVIKQQGGWFLVKTETEEGWMHGNTLKLQSFDINPPRELKSTPEPESPATTTATKDLRIKGNKNSMIYHLPGCASYDRISDKNIIWFKTGEDATAAGFRIAKNC